MSLTVHHSPPQSDKIAFFTCVRMTRPDDSKENSTMKRKRSTIKYLSSTTFDFAAFYIIISYYIYHIITIIISVVPVDDRYLTVSTAALELCQSYITMMCSCLTFTLYVTISHIRVLLLVMIVLAQRHLCFACLLALLCFHLFACLYYHIELV
jgi:hypothetical protein